MSAFAVVRVGDHAKANLRSWAGFPQKPCVSTTRSDFCGRLVLIRARDIACIRLNNSKSWLRFSRWRTWVFRWPGSGAHCKEGGHDRTASHAQRAETNHRAVDPCGNSVIELDQHRLGGIWWKGTDSGDCKEAACHSYRIFPRDRKQLRGGLPIRGGID